MTIVKDIPIFIECIGRWLMIAIKIFE